jgi:hypothetical protein
MAWTFDDAWLGGRGKRTVKEPVALVHPEQRAERIFAPLRAKVEALTSEAPVLAVSLSAVQMAPPHGVTLGLLEGDVARHEKASARESVVSELLAEFGEAHVGLLATEPAWELAARFSGGTLRPVRAGSSERSARTRREPKGQRGSLPEGRDLRPAGSDANIFPEKSATPSRVELVPTRLLTSPVPLVAQTSVVRFLFRLEASAWWRESKIRAEDYVMTREGSKMACAAISVKEGVRDPTCVRVVGWFD